MFNFDLDREDLNRVVNNKTRLNFEKTDIWTSPHIRWHREGLGVWDFLLASRKITPPAEGDIVVISRSIKDAHIEMTCRLLEVHMQSKDVLGHYVESLRYSVVTGRCVMEFVKMKIGFGGA